MKTKAFFCHNSMSTYKAVWKKFKKLLVSDKDPDFQAQRKTLEG